MLGLVMVPGRRAESGSATATLTVNMSIANNCTISTTAVAFGSYDPVSTNATSPLDGTGSVSVACTKNTSATIGLGVGSNASGSTRRMSDGATTPSYATYELYQDSSRSTVWGNSGTGLLSPTAAPSKAARTFSVYGRVPAGQDIPAGSYADSVVATVNF